MKNSALIFMFATCVNVADSHAEDIPHACQTIYVMAASAMESRSKGATEESLRDALPPLEMVDKSRASDEAVILRAMHEITGEVFLAEGISQSVYSTYRAELCVRSSLDLPVAASFSEAAPLLRKCSKGKAREVHECAMKVAGSTEDGT